MTDDKLCAAALALRQRAYTLQQIADELGVDVGRAREALEKVASARRAQPDLMPWHAGLPTHVARMLIDSGYSSRAEVALAFQSGRLHTGVVPTLSDRGERAVQHWLGVTRPSGPSQDDVQKALTVLREAGFDVSALAPAQR
jgi:hypothetical protein